MKKFKLTAFVPTEGSEQEALFDWARAFSPRHPELDLLYAVPNGLPLSGPNKWGVINAAKRRGLKAGFPDAGLPVARNGYHGIFIELKRKKGGIVSPLQEWWMRRLREEGYQVAVAEGADQAIKILETYLSQK